jgi:hypothetical protein
VLEPLIGAIINLNLIEQHFDDILRLASSIKQGSVTASPILRMLAAYPRQNSLAVALRELGRIERTLFTLEWLRDPALRRRVNAGLNKGEARNSLSRAVRPVQSSPRYREPWTHYYQYRDALRLFWRDSAPRSRYRASNRIDGEIFVRNACSHENRRRRRSCL